MSNHFDGAFSRAFIPPCNLAGGRQLSDQSPAAADRNPSHLFCKLWCRVPGHPRLILHSLYIANSVPDAPGPMAPALLAQLAA